MSVPHRTSEPGPASLQEALTKNVPPQNIDAERAVLGGVLAKSSLLDKLAAELREVDFYSPAHRAIWRAMTTPSIGIGPCGA